MILAVDFDNSEESEAEAVVLLIKARYFRYLDDCVLLIPHELRLQVVRRNSLPLEVEKPLTTINKSQLQPGLLPSAYSGVFWLRSEMAYSAAHWGRESEFLSCEAVGWEELKWLLRAGSVELQQSD